MSYINLQFVIISTWSHGLLHRHLSLPSNVLDCELIASGDTDNCNKHLYITT